MTIKELKEILDNYPDEFNVIMSSDAEGNSFSPLYGHMPIKYIRDSEWSGSILAEEDLEPGEEIDSIVLWPIN